MPSKSVHLSLDYTHQIDYSPIGAGLAVFKETSGYSLAKSQNAKQLPAYLPNILSARQRQGIARLGLIKAVLKGTKPLEDLIQSTPAFFVVPPGFRARMARRGYSNACEHYEKPIERLSRSCYDRHLAGKLTLDDVVRLDDFSHFCYDAGGSPLPQVLFFDYLEGQMMSEAYNLNKALKVLQKHPRVYFSGRPMPRPVPEYAEYPPGTMCISFEFEPTLSEMKTIFEKAKKIDKDFPTLCLHEAVRALDLLGLRKGSRPEAKPKQPVPGGDYP